VSFSVHRDDFSAPFFDAAASGSLLIRRCPRCGRHYPPQQRRCPDGEEAEWAPAAGTGVLVTWGVEHGPPPDPDLAGPDGATSVFGYVELDEGPWYPAAIVDADPASLAAGDQMAVKFLRLGDGEPVPVFAPPAS